MENIILISAQPEENYFLWQLETQLYNIYVERKLLCKYHILLLYSDKIKGQFNHLLEKYPLLEIFYYKDERKYKNYQPSIQIHLLFQHFKTNIELVKEVLFLIDSDICFTRDFDISHLLNDNTIYLSDTHSYLQPEYLDSKGDTLCSCLCSLVNVSEEVVRRNSKNHGGAQYLLKNIDSSFWAKVEEDCNRIFKYLQGSVEHYKDKHEKISFEKYHPVQAWTASMWAIVYNFIYFNREFKVHQDLDFSWPNHSIDQWENNFIFHNAGVTSSDQGMFYKGEFINRIPTLEDINKIHQDKCSYNYAQIVKRALSL